jgi:hypothetical protein
MDSTYFEEHTSVNIQREGMEKLEDFQRRIQGKQIECDITKHAYVSIHLIIYESNKPLLPMHRSFDYRNRKTSVSSHLGNFMC